ncbi:hypothetical protein AX17_005553, partial [Amanita inopinata Kibby_2008]
MCLTESLKTLFTLTAAFGSKLATFFFSYVVCFGLTIYYNGIITPQNSADAELGTHTTALRSDYAAHVCSWKAIRLLAVVLS